MSKRAASSGSKTSIFFLIVLYLGFLILGFVAENQEVLIVYKAIWLSLILVFSIVYEKLAKSLLLYGSVRLLIFAAILYFLVGFLGFLALPLFFLAFGRRVKALRKWFIPTFTNLEKHWLLVSLLVGLIIPFAISIPVFVNSNYQFANMPLEELLFGFFSLFLFSLSFSAVIEEILYRSLLWHLLEEKFSRRTSLYATSILFWFSHIGLLDSTFQFWVILPIVSLILGVFVYKSKSLLPSILFHSLYNTLAFYSLPILNFFGA